MTDKASTAEVFSSGLASLLRFCVKTVRTYVLQIYDRIYEGPRSCSSQGEICTGPRGEGPLFWLFGLAPLKRLFASNFPVA